LLSWSLRLCLILDTASSVLCLSWSSRFHCHTLAHRFSSTLSSPMFELVCMKQHYLGMYKSRAIVTLICCEHNVSVIYFDNLSIDIMKKYVKITFHPVLIINMNQNIR
jgi:hypothetical protein